MAEGPHPLRSVITVNPEEEGHDLDTWAPVEWLRADDVYLIIEAYAAQIVDVPEDHIDHPYRTRIADELNMLAEHLRHHRSDT